MPVSRSRVSVFDLNQIQRVRAKGIIAASCRELAAVTKQCFEQEVKSSLLQKWGIVERRWWWGWTIDFQLILPKPYWSESMKTFASFAAAAFAVVASTPIANAQTLLTPPYQTLILQPGATVIRETPLFGVPVTTQPIEIISTVETVRTIHPAQPVVHHHLVASRKIQDRLAVSSARPLYNMATAPVVRTAAATQVVQIQTAATPVVVVGQNLSGEFQCVAGCAAGSAGPAFVTQNGWGLNLVNEVGLPSRAWIDYPGHIWVQSWNEGAVYSPDHMTIQFDNGTVWSKNIILVTPPVR